jgi:hypothetical protein
MMMGSGRNLLIAERLRGGLVALFGLMLGAGAANAQSITIVDPPQWREEQVVVMETRTVLRIAGFVSHPSGVARVLVNGLEATLRPDPDFPDSFTFEISLPADSLKPTVMISVEPRTGEAMTRSFTVQMPPAANAGGQGGGAVRPTAGRTDSTQVIRGGGSPWSGFRTRGIIYAAAVTGGIVLLQRETSESAEICRAVGSGQDCFIQTTTKPASKGLGLAVAGAGAGLLVIDAILTSRKPRSSAGPAGGDNAGFRLEPPALRPSLDRIRLDLIRLRFR